MAPGRAPMSNKDDAGLGFPISRILPVISSLLTLPTSRLAVRLVDQTKSENQDDDQDRKKTDTVLAIPDDADQLRSQLDTGAG